MKAESRLVVARSWGVGNEGILVKGYKVSAMQENKFWRCGGQQCDYSSYHVVHLTFLRG